MASHSMHQVDVVAGYSDPATTARYDKRTKLQVPGRAQAIIRAREAGLGQERM
jgi:hypothetical protein